MTSPWHRLRTHDNRALGCRHAYQVIDGSRKIGRLHVIRIPAKRCVFPTCVDRVVMGSAQSSERGHVYVFDVCSGERSLQFRLIELRISRDRGMVLMSTKTSIAK